MNVTSSPTSDESPIKDVSAPTAEPKQETSALNQTGTLPTTPPHTVNSPPSEKVFQQSGVPVDAASQRVIGSSPGVVTNPDAEIANNVGKGQEDMPNIQLDKIVNPKAYFQPNSSQETSGKKSAGEQEAEVAKKTKECEREFRELYFEYANNFKSIKISDIEKLKNSELDIDERYKIGKQLDFLRKVSQFYEKVRSEPKVDFQGDYKSYVFDPQNAELNSLCNAYNEAKNKNRNFPDYIMKRDIGRDGDVLRDSERRLRTLYGSTSQEIPKTELTPKEQKQKDDFENAYYEFKKKFKKGNEYEGINLEKLLQKYKDNQFTPQEFKKKFTENERNCIAECRNIFSNFRDKDHNHIFFKLSDEDKKEMGDLIPLSAEDKKEMGLLSAEDKKEMGLIPLSDEDENEMEEKGLASYDIVSYDFEKFLQISATAEKYNLLLKSHYSY